MKKKKKALEKGNLRRFGYGSEKKGFCTAGFLDTSKKVAGDLTIVTMTYPSTIASSARTFSRTLNETRFD